MKFVEIASAEEQLALWKLVNDSVWTAIQSQSADERKRKAKQGAGRKPKPKAKRAGAVRPKKPITFKPPPKPKARPQHVRQQAQSPLPPSLSTHALPPITLKSGQTTGDFAASVPPAASGPVGGEA